MIARKNRRHRDSGPMFPFGDIMLPVIGIVALGLLVVGIKMFFMPAKPEKEYMPVTVSQSPAKHMEIKEQEKKIVLSDKPKSAQVKNQPIAIPVSSSSEKGVTHITNTVGNSGSTEINKENKETIAVSARPEATKATVKSVTSTVQGVTGTGVWNVQIGSFSTMRSAEQEAKRANKAGFKAGITEVNVKGKTYHRVYVPAGSKRSDAVLLEKKLKNAGFPTFVIHY